jgi:branched-chain amino acid transport system permease protein
MHDFAQQLINGLSVGATYALIALGYTMVYGVLRLINFAHGEIYMVGGVTGFYLVNLATGWGWPVWAGLTLAFAGAIVVCGMLGFVIEYFAYRPLRAQPRLVSLITAIGVSLLLQNVVLLKWVYGPTPKPYAYEVKEAMTARVVETPVIVGRIDLLVLVLSLALMGVLTFIILRTRTGLALRAASYRFDTAMLMGVNTDRTISFTFVLGSSLAAVAGVMDGIKYNVEPLMGVLPGLKAFVAAVVGGIGSIPGALVGALVIGLTESMVKAYVSSAYSDAIVFGLLIVILLVKPNGLLGRAGVEKV